MIYEMNINNRIERIDNGEVKEDHKGYYITKAILLNLWSNEKEKIYLTNEEIKEYNRILKHNNNELTRQLKIEDAKINNRVLEVPQKISNDIIGVIAYIYYDEVGNQI